MERQAVVIGGGAREHALVHGLAPYTERLWATPGNGGMAREAELFEAASPDELIHFFGSHRPLVVIGPEAPLAKGWSDVLRRADFPVVGPSEAASRLESSKRFAKEVMRASRIPTARARTAHRPEELLSWIANEDRWPKVIKQSGLAQGKGVAIAADRADAQAVADVLVAKASVWEDGVLFEDYLAGYELSVQVVTNGRDYQWLPVAKDYKRLTPDPQSPNTGGMGATAPVMVESGLVSRINRQVFDPLMEYLQREQLDYRGVLYAGLMVTHDGPMVLEFNVRLGDPETEVIVPILDVDWYRFWWDVSQGVVPHIPAPTKTAVAVVMAAEGYPGTPRTGMPIDLGTEGDATIVFHAGTQVRGHQYESRGGRVLAVVGAAETLDGARRTVYERLSRVGFPHSYYRPDIGQ